MKNKKVCVLVGGPGKEKDVSKISGSGVLKALQELECVAKMYEIESKETFLKNIEELKKEYDIFFNMIHGTFGEDGEIQKIFEEHNMIHTSCSSSTAANTFDKNKTKQIAQSVNIPIARDFESLRNAFEVCEKVVIKPAKDGSSFGVKIIPKEEFQNNTQEVDSEMIIEEYIDGHDVTIGILEDEVFGVVKIIPKEGWYDYKNKYTSGATVYEFPAKISKELTQTLQAYTQKIYKACLLTGMARADFRLTKEGRIVFLEINTIPGMTPTSLMPKSASVNGYSFNQLIEKIVQTTESNA